MSNELITGLSRMGVNADAVDADESNDTLMLITTMANVQKLQAIVEGVNIVGIVPFDGKPRLKVVVSLTAINEAIAANRKAPRTSRGVHVDYTSKIVYSVDTTSASGEDVPNRIVRAFWDGSAARGALSTDDGRDIVVTGEDGLDHFGDKGLGRTAFVVRGESGRVLFATYGFTDLMRSVAKSALRVYVDDDLDFGTADEDTDESAE